MIKKTNLFGYEMQLSGYIAFLLFSQLLASHGNADENSSNVLHYNFEAIAKALREFQSSVPRRQNDDKSFEMQMQKTFEPIARLVIDVEDEFFQTLTKAWEESRDSTQRKTLMLFSKLADKKFTRIDFAFERLMHKVDQSPFEKDTLGSPFNDYPYAEYLIHEDIYERAVFFYMKKKSKEVSNEEITLISHVLNQKYSAGTGPKRILAMLQLEIDHYADPMKTENLKRILEKIREVQDGNKT